MLVKASQGMTEYLHLHLGNAVGDTTSEKLGKTIIIQTRNGTDGARTRNFRRDRAVL
jgi:hypothetical protein